MISITGLNSISTDLVRPFLKFIAKTLPLYKDISIEEKDGMLIINNSESYLIITEYEELELMREYEENLFKELTSDLREDVKKYIDQDAWLADNGLGNFKEYWLKVYEDSLTYIDTIDGYYFYKVGE